MHHQRLIVITPELSDSTAFIRSLSEIPVEMPPPDANPQVISMKFGRLTLGEQTRLYLFGLPWGLDYAEMWHVVGRDLLGVVAGGDAADSDAVRLGLTDFAADKLLWLDDVSRLQVPRNVLSAIFKQTGHVELTALLPDEN